MTRLHVPVEFSDEANAAYLSFVPGPQNVAWTGGDGDQVMTDYDVDGNVLGVEILGEAARVLRARAEETT